jgi:hypothetical protein
MDAIKISRFPNLPPIYRRELSNPDRFEVVELKNTSPFKSQGRTRVLSSDGRGAIVVHGMTPGWSRRESSRISSRGSAVIRHGDPIAANSNVVRDNCDLRNTRKQLNEEIANVRQLPHY